MKNKPPQTFNDGLCHVYTVENAAKAGNMKQERLVKKTGPLRYQMRTVGMGRYWKAQQDNARVDVLIRIQRQLSVSTQDVCILRDGEQYLILQVQHPTDTVPPCTDLSLERIEQKYDLAPIS